MYQANNKNETTTILILWEFDRIKLLNVEQTLL